ncbi:MAG: ATP-binding cassette domain-containing protein [Planctomycetes bacterium]|nr:ATP-binding cassette domain-containing protein [Planctomycetota bacterium]
MIQVQDLTKIFHDAKRGDIRALDGVSLTIPPGTVFGLLGPNGAGKTTFLRILATLLKPSRGTAKIDGIDVAQNPVVIRRRMGYMSTDTGVYPRLTAREMVEFFAELHGMPAEEITSRSEEIFDLLEMHDFKDTIIGKLSSGMKQKVSIARTIIHDPPVLLFDEPAANLDVLVARAVDGFIDRCRSEDKTILLSTHIIIEAERLCNRIAIIFNGEILHEGTPAEIKEKVGGDTLEEAFFRLIDAAKHPGAAVEAGP